MTMRWLLPVAVVALAGCYVCPADRHVQTGYAAMASHGAEIAACVAQKDCAALCTGLFTLDADAEIARCKITELVLADSTTQPGPVTPSTDMTSALGVNVSVGYVERNRCGSSTGPGPGPGDVGVNDGWDDIWGDGWSDEPYDDGWCADGWCDDGSDDDGSCDDGSCDGGSDDGDWGDDGPDDDGGWDDGGGDDGGWDDGGDDGGGDDGGGDDGGGDDGGGDDGGGDFRRAPAPPRGQAQGPTLVSHVRPAK